MHLCIWRLYFVFCLCLMRSGLFGTTERTKTWLALQDMLAWILTLVSVSFPVVCICVFFLCTVRQCCISHVICYYRCYRTKQEGWFGISWICTDVLPKREVKFAAISFLTIVLFSLCMTSSYCSLPWQGLKAGTKKQKYEKISEKKVSTTIEVIYLHNWLLEFL